MGILLRYYVISFEPAFKFTVADRAFIDPELCTPRTIVSIFGTTAMNRENMVWKSRIYCRNAMECPCLT